MVLKEGINLLYIPIIALGLLLYLGIAQIFGDTKIAIILTIIYTFTVAFIIGQLYGKTRQYKTKYL